MKSMLVEAEGVLSRSDGRISASERAGEKFETTSV